MKLSIKLRAKDVDKIVLQRLDQIKMYALEEKASQLPNGDEDEIIAACNVLRKYHLK